MSQHKFKERKDEVESLQEKSLILSHDLSDQMKFYSSSLKNSDEKKIIRSKGSLTSRSNIEEFYAQV